MKTIRKDYLPALFSILSAFLLFVSCGEQKPKIEADETKEQEIQAPEQIVSVEQARSMYESYTQRRVPLIQKYEDAYDKRESQMKDSFDVARYVAYDYKTIKDYLAYIEQEAANANVEISTLRFYFSNYPDKAKSDDGRPVIHPRQNSVFILPATTVDNNQYGFYIQEKEDGSTVPAYLRWNLDPYTQDGMGSIPDENKSYAGMGPSINSPAPISTNFLQPGASRSTILNEGSSGPPPHNN